jgi:hypothetical protein
LNSKYATSNILEQSYQTVVPAVLDTALSE